MLPAPEPRRTRTSARRRARPAPRRRDTAKGSDDLHDGVAPTGQGPMPSTVNHASHAALTDDGVLPALRVGVATVSVRPRTRRARRWSARCRRRTSHVHVARPSQHDVEPDQREACARPDRGAARRRRPPAARSACRPAAGRTAARSGTSSTTTSDSSVGQVVDGGRGTRRPGRPARPRATRCRRDAAAARCDGTPPAGRTRRTPAGDAAALALATAHGQQRPAAVRAGGGIGAVGVAAGEAVGREQQPTAARRTGRRRGRATTSQSAPSHGASLDASRGLSGGGVGRARQQRRQQSDRGQCSPARGHRRAVRRAPRVGRTPAGDGLPHDMDGEGRGRGGLAAVIHRARRPDGATSATELRRDGLRSATTMDGAATAVRRASAGHVGTCDGRRGGGGDAAPTARLTRGWARPRAPARCRTARAAHRPDGRPRAGGGSAGRRSPRSGCGVRRADG